MKQDTKTSEFIGKILYDLNTPVIAQINALEQFLPASKKKLSSDEVDLIKLTINSCKYMQNLIWVFDMVEKIDFETLKLCYEQFDFIELVNHCLKEINILFKYYGLVLKLDFDKKIIIKADKVLLKRVISLMLSLGVNYCFKNSTINLFVKENKGSVFFELKIPSPSISEKIMNEIFEKNKTHTSYFSKAGVGLSLYLSKEIINAHHGNMNVASLNQDINVFGFCIPLK